MDSTCRAVCFDAVAGADEVAIAVDIVDASDRGPELVLAQVGQRVSGLFARVGVVPCVATDDFGRMRCVFERVVLRVELAICDGGDLRMDGDHRIAEAIDFRFRFRLGWFDHERAGDRPAHGGRVEAVVHEAFGDIFDGDSAGFAERADIDDAFVSDQAVVAGVEDREKWREEFGDVVGVEDRDFGGLLESARPHHRDVHP